jgi:hypothetical protein
MRSVPFILLSLAAVLLAQQTEFVNKSVVKAGGVAAGMPSTVAFIGGEMVGGPTVTGAPYSAEAVTESTQTLADGNRIVNKSTSKIYRDSAGRERREESLPKIGTLGGDNGGPMAIMISDPVAKANYTLQANSKRAMKMAAPSLPAVAGRGEVSSGVFTSKLVTAGGGVGVAVSGGAAPMVNQLFVYSGGKDGLAPKTEDLGKRVIEGVEAEGTRTTITIPAGQAGNERAMDIVSERWYSPELQVVVLSRHSDPRMGETVYQLTNVSRVEPLPSLFQIPSDYQVDDMQGLRQQKLQTIERGQKNDE